MSVPAAYIGVVLIWATTPLAIKWSSDGVGYLFGVTSRMVLGVFVCLVLIALLSRRMRWHKQALKTYLAAGLGLWGAMTFVYWGAQFVSSGLISVMFGFLPVVTGIFGGIWLGEKAFTPFKILGMLLGIGGLSVIFLHAGQTSEAQLFGLAAVILSVNIHSVSSVWVKKINAGLPALETTTGALMVAVPLFTASWWLLDGGLPETLKMRAVWSILYLGIVGSVLGFILYFYVLRHVEATKVALVTLMTPILALLIGQWFNDEVIGVKELIGSLGILAGLASYMWGDRLVSGLRGDSRFSIRE